MKKLLVLLSAVSLSVFTATTVIACSKTEDNRIDIGLDDNKPNVIPGNINLHVTAGAINEEFLQSMNLKEEVERAFSESSNLTIKGAVPDTDYITSVADPTATQTTGPLKFTVTAQCQTLKGSFSFIVEIQPA